MSLFDFKTNPFAHQLKGYEESKDRLSYGILWEPGCGKTWVALNTIEHLYLTGKANCLVVIAPEGVHRNWIDTEIPRHLPNTKDDLLSFSYSSPRHATNEHISLCNRALSHEGLVVVSMTYDAACTDPVRSKVHGRWKDKWIGGRQFILELLSKRKCLLVADESRRIKTPKADRTKTLLAASPLASYRRILNGTPVVNGPFDLYTQIKFIDPTYWARQGIGSYVCFCTQFGKFDKGHARTRRTAKNPTGIIEFPKLTGYQNLEQLRQMLLPISSRVTKDEVLDLPPKLYSDLLFDLSPEQWRVYNDLKRDCISILSSGDIVSTPLALTRLLRFQQICSGFVPVDNGNDDFEFALLGGKNPRLDLVTDMIDDTDGIKTVIWCRFRKSIELITAALKKMGRNYGRYDGTTDSDERVRIKNEFQDGEMEWVVANAQTAGEGLTWTACHRAWYYENTFNLGDRLQSEDRFHRIGQLNPVGYTDFAARGTVDQYIVSRNRMKMDIADTINGDSLRRAMNDPVGVGADCSVVDTFGIGDVPQERTADDLYAKWL